MYIVNKHGVTHLVADRSLTKDERLATEAEIAAYDAPTPSATPNSTGAPSLELANAIAERDAEIARLQAALNDKAKK